MSKYDKLNYNDNGKSPLVEGENLIWSGKPKKRAFVMNKVLFMLPIAMAWLCFDLFFIITLISQDNIGRMLFFIIPFFIIHLMPFWVWIGNVITANRKWNNTKYYITDKRIIIQNGFVAENYQTVYYKDIKNVNLHVGIIDKMLGVGDIIFDMGSYYSNGNSRLINASFLDIEDYSEVYSKVQKVILDIQTDIEYPNALRPENNPGYNTKYEPKN